VSLPCAGDRVTVPFGAEMEIVEHGVVRHIVAYYVGGLDVAVRLNDASRGEIVVHSSDENRAWCRGWLDREELLACFVAEALA
jgi:hypothetical protein